MQCQIQQSVWLTPLMVRMLPPTLGISACSWDLSCIHDHWDMDVSHACGRPKNRSSFSSVAYLFGLNSARRGSLGLLFISLHRRVILALRCLDPLLTGCCISNDVRWLPGLRPVVGLWAEIGLLVDFLIASRPPLETADQTQSTTLTVSLSNASFPNTNTMLWDTWSMDECRLILARCTCLFWKLVGFSQCWKKVGAMGDYRKSHAYIHDYWRVPRQLENYFWNRNSFFGLPLTPTSIR